MSEKRLSEADRRAWQAAMRHVRPLGTARPGARFDGAAAAPPAAPVGPAALPRQSRPAPSPARPLDRGNDRRVRRGKLSISARFDLHGHTQDTAWRALPNFLAQQRAGGADCVIVITGKGRSGEGVLRRNFLHWLELPEARALITGYAPAHPRHGGSGAWYVFLRKS